MLNKKKIKQLANKRILEILIEHYGIQVTLLTSFISIILAGSEYPTLKQASGIALIAVPTVYCVAVCILITKSNRRLVNYMLSQSKR